MDLERGQTQLAKLSKFSHVNSPSYSFMTFQVERARRLFIDAKIRELGLLLPGQNEA